MIQWILAIWSLVPLPFVNPAWTSGSSWFSQCWSLACKILSMTLLAWECNCLMANTFVSTMLLGNSDVDLFQSCGHCWVFQICWYIECNTLMASSFRVLKSLLEFRQSINKYQINWLLYIKQNAIGSQYTRERICSHFSHFLKLMWH